MGLRDLLEVDVFVTDGRETEAAQHADEPPTGIELAVQREDETISVLGQEAVEADDLVMV